MGKPRKRCHFSQKMFIVKEQNRTEQNRTEQNRTEQNEKGDFPVNNREGLLIAF
jgi:hypothetical protein